MGTIKEEEINPLLVSCEQLNCTSTLSEQQGVMIETSDSEQSYSPDITHES